MTATHSLEQMHIGREAGGRAGSPHGFLVCVGAADGLQHLADGHRIPHRLGGDHTPAGAGWGQQGQQGVKQEQDRAGAPRDAPDIARAAVASTEGLMRLMRRA